MSNKRLAAVDKQKSNPTLTEKDVNRLNDLISDDNPFSAKLDHGQLLWISHEEVDCSNVEEVVKLSEQEGRSIHINTGTHGDKHGNIVCSDNVKTSNYAEESFTKEDLVTAWVKDKVSVHIVSKFSPPLTHKHYPHIDIINAWCFSRKTEIKSGDKEQEKRVTDFFSGVAAGREKEIQGAILKDLEIQNIQGDVNIDASTKKTIIENIQKLDDEDIDKLKKELENILSKYEKSSGNTSLHGGKLEKININNAAEAITIKAAVNASGKNFDEVKGASASNMNLNNAKGSVTLDFSVSG